MTNPPIRYLIPALLTAALLIIFTTAKLASADYRLSLQVSMNSESPVSEETNANDLKVTDVGEDCSISYQFIDAVRMWCETIQTSGQDEGIDPNLIAAVIQVESAGDPDAYSYSGAVGLMQVMPRDGLAANFQCINGPCFSGRPSMAELYDPAFNIAYGTRLLQGYINKNNNLRDGLFAYGPAGVGYSYADKVLAVYSSSVE